MTIGDKINELLAIRDMKKIDLVKRTGISSGLISEYCNNKRTEMTVNTLKRIADALGIHPAYFLEEVTLGPSDLMPHLTEDEREFVLSKKSLPWIKISHEAEKQGLTPEKVRQIMNILSE